MTYIKGYQLNAWYWSVLAFGYLALTVRIYINQVKRLRDISICRDLMVFLGMLCYTGSCAIISLQVDWGVFDLSSSYFWQTSPKSAVVSNYKMNYACFWLSFGFRAIIEADLLFLYHQLAPRNHHPKFFRMILVGWFCTGLYAVMTFVWLFTSRRPLSDQWNTDGKCTWDTNYLYEVWGPFLLSEFAVYVIPLIIIIRLPWSFKQKLAAFAMFSVGFLNLFAILSNIIVQVYERLYISSYSKEKWNELYTFTQAMSGVHKLTAILVVCMPQLKTFYSLIKEGVSRSRGKSSIAAEGVELAPRGPAVGKEVPVNINVSTLGDWYA